MVDLLFIGQPRALYGLPVDLSEEIVGAVALILLEQLTIRADRWIIDSRYQRSGSVLA